ncbi:50S ribosomal protein L18 [Candidatus Woesearchaeota archaeon]|nr:50S ribosomal protein L18 [Candidatus Woesearchaeota archaeon]
MVNKKPKTVPFRRRREQKTNYLKRLELLKSGKPRLVLRFSNSRIITQVIELGSKGDKVLLGLDSLSLKELGWNYSLKNMSACYLTGLLVGKKALEKNVKEAIFDLGLLSPLKKGRAYAFLKGVVDSGFKVPHSDGHSIFPEEKILSGEKVQKHALSLKNQTEKYKQQFAQYLKSGNSPEEIMSVFEKVKQKIKGGK